MFFTIITSYIVIINKFFDITLLWIINFNKIKLGDSMDTRIELLKKYGVDVNRVASLELLETVSVTDIEGMLIFLNENELLRSKFVINALANIIKNTTVSNIKTVKEILDSNGYDSYSILYKANKVILTSNFDKINDVIQELQKEEYHIDHKKIINGASSLLVTSNSDFIKDVTKLLRKYNLDITTVSNKSGLIFDPRPIQGMEDILLALTLNLGKDLTQTLIYKCPSIIIKGSAKDIGNIIDLLKEKLGEQEAIDYIIEYPSVIGRCSENKIREIYSLLEELGLESLIGTSANILIYGNAYTIRKNFNWLIENHINIDVAKATTVLTTPHEVLVRNYNFYNSHNLSQYLQDSPSALAANKATEDLEDIYNYLVSLGISDFSTYLSVFTMSNIIEIKEIHNALTDEVGKELADKLIVIPSILTTNYSTLHSSLTFIREHDLFDQLEEKPYVLSETRKDKMDRNLAFLSTLELTDLRKNLIVLARGEVNNMKDILAYFEELNISSILEQCPTLLVKKYKNVKNCIDYFIKEGKLNVILTTPSIALLKVDEVEQAARGIKDLDLEDEAAQSHGLYRAKHIKTNATTVSTDKFKGIAGIAAVYSTATVRLNTRKEFYDQRGLQHLYEKCPSILSEGDLAEMDLVLDYLIIEGLEEILEKSPSVFPRLKLKELQERLEHLYKLGVTKDEIINNSAMLIRYSDEQILKTLEYHRSRKRS